MQGECGGLRCADSAEESRTAWGRRAKDFYGEGSSDESSEDEEEMQERMAEAVRVAEVEDVEGMTEADFSADARSIEALKQLLALQQKTLGSKDQQQLEPVEGKEGTEQDLLWKARLDAVSNCLLLNQRKYFATLTHCKPTWSCLLLMCIVRLGARI